jgi:hypothetical protein
MIFVQFCDTVRIENNNKFILVGLYSEFMNVPANEFRGSIEGFLTITEVPGEFNLRLQYSLGSGDILGTYALRAEAGDERLTTAQIPLPAVDLFLKKNDSLILSVAMNDDKLCEVGKLNITLQAPLHSIDQINT